MKRCLIFTAYCEGDPAVLIGRESYNVVLCADGGYLFARQAGVSPDLIIGDFDSADRPDSAECDIIQVPVEKDDTDTMLCIKKALEMGCEELTLLGGIGGRLDHTIANIQSLAYAAQHGARAVLRDANHEIRILLPGAYSVPRRSGKLSLFAYSEEVCGLSSRGVQYAITDARLDSFFPLGVSNVITEDTAEISFTSGILMLILAKED